MPSENLIRQQTYACHRRRRGLGEASARKLAETGGRIAIEDIDFNGALMAASQIKGSGAYRCDFGDPEDIVKLHQKLRDEISKGIDIMINNAGIIAYT